MSSCEPRERIQVLRDKVLPQSASDWVAASGALAVILSLLLARFLSLDPMNPALFQRPDVRFVHILSVGGKILMASALIVSGLRRMRRDRANWRSAARFLGGVALCVFFAVAAVVFSHLVEKAGDALDALLPPESVQQFDDILRRQDLTPDKRSVWSRMRAQEQFYLTGRITEYLTPHGDSTRFDPTAEDISTRRLVVQFPRLQAALVSDFRRTSLLWVAVLVLSCVAGLLAPVSLSQAGAV